MSKKIFKDLFDKEIKIGDTVINLWADHEYHHQKTNGIVRYRLAKVIDFRNSSIRIEYLKNNELVECNVFCTRNKIIIMTKDKEIIYTPNINEEIKKKDKKIDNLFRHLKIAKNVKDKMAKEIEEHKQAIKKLEENFTRFDLLDL